MLGHWVRDDGCRLVAVYGTGGIGKTRLVAFIARNVASSFERTFWRSLRNAPSATEWLGDAIAALSGQATIAPDGEAARVSVLLQLLRAQRCLVVLDNFETLLEPGRRDGTYRADVGGYGELLHVIGQSKHQSCVILTSREVPAELAELQNEHGPVRVLELRGMGVADTKDLLGDKLLYGEAQTWSDLSTAYSGNPLALKVVGVTVQQVFGGDIATFLAEAAAGSGLIYGGIRRLIDAQMQRLSPLELDVLRWLAVERDPVTFAELAADVDSLGRSVLIEVIDALRRRSLVERIEPGSKFTLQSVVLEHVTASLVEAVADEIEHAAAHILTTHALLKAQSNDYVRRAQERLLLSPVLDRLRARNGAPIDAQTRLIELLDELRRRPRREHGNAPGNLVNLLRLERGDLTGRDLSALAIRQAFLQDTEMQDASLAGSDVAGCVFADVFSGPLCVALSGDGVLLAAGTFMGDVYIWRVSDRALLSKLHGHNGTTIAVSLSDDGTLLASSSDDGTVKLWDVPTGQLLRMFGEHVGGALSVALSGDGRLVASGDGGGTVRVWSTSDGRQLAQVRGQAERIWGIALDRAGSVMASASRTSVNVWQPESCQLIAALEGHHGGNYCIGVSGNGRLVACGSFDGNVRVWQVSTGELVATLPGHASGAWSVALTDDGQRLVSGSFDATVRSWDPVAGRLVAAMSGQTGAVRGVSVARDGRVLASASFDGTVMLWQSDGQLLGTLRGYTSGIRAIAVSRGGDLCASGSFDRTVRLWDLRAERLIATWSGHTGSVWAVAVSPDGELIASGGDDGAVRLWRVGSEQSIAVLAGHKGAIFSIVISPDAREIVSGSLDGTVRVWTPTTSEIGLVLDAQNGPVWGVARSHDGRVLASAGDAGSISLWDGERRTLRNTFAAHASGIWSLALSKDGHLLASASFDGTVRLWDTSTEQCLAVLEGHTGGVWSVALSADGRLLASGGFDQTVRLWDTQTGREVRVMRGHTAGVWSVAFADDDHMLASAGVDGTICRWNAEEGALLCTLRRDRVYERLDITGLTGITAAQRGALFALGALERTSGGEIH